jgi:hypothetical protein
VGTTRSAAEGEVAPSAEEFLAAYPAQIQVLAEALRRLIRRSVPEAIERVAVGWRLIGYRAPDDT